MRKAGLSVLLLAALATLGHLLAPAWQPRPLPPGAAPESLPPLPAPLEPMPDLPVRSDEARIAVDGEELAGRIYAPDPGSATPPGAAESRPGVVMVHGAGPGRAADLADQAERMAAAGIVALVYDKRTDGYSVTRRDYGQLADDALAALQVLRQRPGVDPHLVGLWGISEGGWVVPIAAARSATDAVAPGGGVDFAVLVSAPTVSPVVQAVWTLDSGL